MIISMVKSCTATETKSVEVCALLEAIRNGKYRQPVEKIRRAFQSNNGSRAKIDGLKKQLPAVMFSGRFSCRASNALVEHSGLICADLDQLGEKLSAVRGTLEWSPHLLGVFSSPSGDGLKAVFRVPADASRHADSFRAIARHVRELAGVDIDGSGKDPARLCFVSYDPDLETFDDATEIEPLPSQPKRPAQTGMADLALRQRAAVELLGSIDWHSETHGFLACPGHHLHTAGNGERDCEIHLDGAPTVHCFHDSCRGIIDGVNHELRSRIGKAEKADKARLSDKSETENANAEDETIRRLAEMSLLEYEKARKDAAKELGCRPSILDSLVRAQRLLNRPPGENDLQGAPVKLADIEPWPDPVNGAETFDAIAERFTRYVVMPEGAADELALWCAHAHVFNLFQCSPRQNISSPEKQCGKSTLRDVGALFVPRPVIAENLTTAVLFRLASAQHPVVLADECDTWLVENEELKSLFNSGHRKGGVVMRCEGDNNEVRAFSCYAPAMLCGIGTLPATLHDRSIVIRLERAKHGEIQARFDSRHVEYEHELCRKLARWCVDNRDRIEACDPQLPDNAFNRLADNWRPLFAIAEVAGGDWPQRCADAFTKLTSTAADADSLRMMLLTDIREIFKDERMFSKDLIEALAEMKERPWPEVCRGKPMTERWLARNLAAFRIHPKLLRIGEDKLARGYELSDFGESFSRYLPDTAFSSVTPLQHEGKPPFSKCYKKESVTDSKSAPYIGKCNGVTDKKAGGPCNIEKKAVYGSLKI